ncbi:MAG: class I SAM-dependent methyltransferase [Muribaculaceae bacterium]|nr:class I SAM-dependent methyltransferase [Muribaculaceae bacterium]
MANIVTYYRRSRCPERFWGGRALKKMNGAKHAALPEWVLEDLEIADNCRLLDIGCGGGANLNRMLSKNPTATAVGMDISKLAMEMTHEVNYRDIVDKRLLLLGGNATQMPLARESYDLVTAFETIYYWHSMELGTEEMYRVLRPGGTCLIANEMDGLAEDVRSFESAVGGFRVYTIDEITEYLVTAGFTDIQSRHDEARHFICVTGKKP